jgi:hypothetical protein
MNPVAWPPPPVASDAGRDGTWRSPGYRSSATRGRAVVAAVGATVIASAVAVLVDLYGVVIVNGAEDGTLTVDDAYAFDALNGAVALVQLGLLFASAATVLAWLSRVVENVPPLTGSTPRRSPREAIGWWFVPFVSFVVPYQIASDAMRRLRTGDEGAERLLRPWWATWVTLNIMGGIIFQLPQDTLEELRVGFVLTAVFDGLYVASGLLLMLIVRAIEWRTAVRVHTFGLDRLPQPAWPAFVTTPPVAAPPGPPPPEPPEGSDR